LAATTTPITATYDNGTNGVDATLTIAATATLDIDGQTSWEVGDGVLVKNQVNAFENGRYYVITVGDAGTDWVLKRCIACDEADEIPSSYVFVQDGNAYGATGWVALVENPATFTVGTDDIIWTQFSGAGTYTNGYGLTLNGTEFAVDTAEIATQEDLGNAVDDVTAYVDGFLNSNDGTTIQYIDAQDLATLASANSYTDTAIETGDATATPTYLALDVNSLIKYEAAEQIASHGDPEFPYFLHSFSPSEYRSAKYIVKASRGTHTEVSEVLVTLDTSDNIAITEYGVVGTNGSLATISASIEYGQVTLTAVATADGMTTYTTVATLIK
jgi:hypothetical protein